MADLETPQFDDELLSAYLDDELTPAERARVEERLAADPAARHLLEELRTVSRAMKELPTATLGADLRESVLRRAERAMLLSGERASAHGTNEVARTFPIGRSRRAWFWAATALTAGILLMVFERAPEQNSDLPGQVAQRKRVAQRERVTLQRNEPLPPLEVRAIEPAREDVAERRESPPTDSAAVPPASSEPERLAVAPGRELDSQVRQEMAAPIGGGGLAGAGVRSGPQVELKSSGDATGEDLLVVHVDVKPEAMRNRAFDALLSKNQIEVEQPAVDKPKSDEPQDVDVVVVEAAPAQIYSCLSDLKKDDANYVGIAVDDRLATSQRALAEKEPAADLTQYNRGIVLIQQQPQLAPDNNYYFKTNRGQVEFDRKHDRQSVVAAEQSRGTELGFSMQGRTTHVEPSANSPGLASPSPSAGNETPDLSDELQQTVARRAMQKLVAKADTMQVLFVLTCPSELTAPGAASTSAAPTSSVPVEEGLKIDER